VVAGLVVAAVAAVALWPGRFPLNRDVALDDRLLAVAPFEAREADLQVWHEGFMDILSRNFDGAGPIRTVPPTLVVRQRITRIDQVSRRELSRALGARFVFHGSLLLIPGDSVRVVASMYDAVGDSVIGGDIQIEDAVQRIAALTDSLTMRGLAALNPLMRIAVARRASLGSPTLPALKAFLEGERLYRMNDFAAARTHYERALELQPTFALALRRMRGVLRGQGGGEFDSASFDYALRAGQFNRGLSPRESLLVAADSLAATLPRAAAFVDIAYVSRLRRRVALLEEASRRFPEDPEVWGELGEATFHLGSRIGISQEQALSAFQAALRTDSAYGPAFYHAVELSLNRMPDDSVARLARDYLHLNPGDARFQVFARILGAPVRRGDSAWFDTLPPRDRFAAAILLGRWTDTAQTAVAMLRSLSGRRDSLSADDPAIVRPMLARALMYRGRLRDAWSEVDPAFVRLYPHRVVQLALFGAAPNDTVARWMSQWLEEDDLGPPIMAAPWWSRTGDTTSLRRLQQRSERARSTATSPTMQTMAEYGSLTALAWLALARRDTASAIGRFRALPDSLCLAIWCYLNTHEAARLLHATGQPREAALLLDRFPPDASTMTVSEVLWALERARVATRLGDPAVARRDYALVLRAWVNADSTLQPAVREARAYLARGGGGTQGAVPQ
jgi:serine/threonine-protein kinase